MNSICSPKRIALACICLVFLAGTLSWAGVIKGKVSGVASGKSVAVYIDTIAGKTFPAPDQHASMDQKDLKFSPHALVVLKGTTVDFVNSDKVLHNVFWPSISGNKKLAHNLGTWPQGEHKSFTFDTEGAVPLLCNVHPEMAGYVVVVPTPYFALADNAGNYEIKDVPAGKYTLKTWSEEGKPATQSVDVTSGTTTADLTIPR